VLETYNSSGQLTNISDRSGLVTNLNYDAQGHLASVVNPFGHSLSFAYKDSLVNFVTVAGRTVYQYDYDANRLVKVTFPDKNFHRYLYENSQNPHVLTGIVDGKGKRFAVKDNPLRFANPKAVQACILNPASCATVLQLCRKAVTDIAKYLSLGYIVEQVTCDSNNCPNGKDIVYPDNPDVVKDKFIRITGTKAKQSKDDGSVWAKDTSNHGGDQWKRWPNRKSWEKGNTPNSIWPDGRIRK
jgi:YD repeat-containing protein